MIWNKPAAPLYGLVAPGFRPDSHLAIAVAVAAYDPNTWLIIPATVLLLAAAGTLYVSGALYVTGALYTTGLLYCCAGGADPPPGMQML